LDASELEDESERRLDLPQFVKGEMPHLNAKRSMLREYYPAALLAFGDDLAGRDALAVLAIASTPRMGAQLSVARVQEALSAAGRQRNVATTAEKIVTALASEPLAAREGVVSAYGVSVRALVAVITAMAVQVEVLQGEVEAGFGRHPDVEIYRSQPGLGDPRCPGARRLR